MKKYTLVEMDTIRKKTVDSIQRDIETISSYTHNLGILVGSIEANKNLMPWKNAMLPNIKTQITTSLDNITKSLDMYITSQSASATTVAGGPNEGAVGRPLPAETTPNGLSKAYEEDSTFRELVAMGRLGDAAEYMLFPYGSNPRGGARRRRTHKVRARKQRKSCKSRSH